MKIINRPTWWTLLLFIPIINLFMFPIIWIETLRTFGKKTTLDMVLGVVTLGLYIFYVNYTQELTYHADRDLKAPTKANLRYAVAFSQDHPLLSGRWRARYRDQKAS